MMNTLIVIKGLPMSGKTTWARQWASEKQNRIRISWTDIINILGKEFRRERSSLAVDAALRLMLNAFRKNMDVVLDECNLYGPDWSVFVGKASQAHAKIVYKSFKTSPEECKKRNALNGHPYSDEMIDKLWQKWGDWINR